MTTREITIRGREHSTAREARHDRDASGWDYAITVGGKYVCLDADEFDRLTAAGIYLAILCNHRLPNGEHRILTVPVN